RQAHRSRQFAQRVPYAPASRTRGVCARRHRHHDTAAPAPDLGAGFHQRRLRHTLAGEFRRDPGVASRSMNRLTPDMMLRAYAYGIFPMAEGRSDPAVHWIEPERRGIIPLDTFRVPCRLGRTGRKCVFDVRCDTDFVGVSKGCAASVSGREDTWINRSIENHHPRLHELGFAHSIETWQDGKL